MNCQFPSFQFPGVFFYSQQKRRKPFSFDPTDPLKAAASQVDKSNGWDFRLAGPGAKKRRRFFSNRKWARIYPIPSMYGIFTYIYHTNQPNVGKYTIHGSYGYMVYFSFLMSRVHYWRTWFIVLLRSRKKTKKTKKSKTRKRQRRKDSSNPPVWTKKVRIRTLDRGFGPGEVQVNGLKERCPVSGTLTSTWK